MDTEAPQMAASGGSSYLQMDSRQGLQVSKTRDTDLQTQKVERELRGIQGDAQTEENLGGQSPCPPVLLHLWSRLGE